MSGNAVKTKYQTGERRLIHRSEITNAPYNPRKISNSNRARLRESIKTHGLVGGIVWNERTKNLVGGHQRLSQVDELEKAKKGDYLIEVDVVDLDDMKERALNIILNNPSVSGEWDMDLLQGVLEDLSEGGVQFEEAGFSENDLNMMFPSVFLSSEAADQEDAELEVLSEIDDIKRMGAEQDVKFRHDAKSQPFAESEDGMPDVDGMEEDDGKDHENDYEPEEEKTKTIPKRAVINEETGEKDWTDEQRGNFSKIRKEHWETTDEEVAGDTVILLTFQNPKQLQRFVKKVGIDDVRHLNVIEIERIFGIELRGE